MCGIVRVCGLCVCVAAHSHRHPGGQVVNWVMLPVNRTENGTNTIYQIVIFELTPISKKVVVNGPP